MLIGVSDLGMQSRVQVYIIYCLMHDQCQHLVLHSQTAFLFLFVVSEKGSGLVYSDYSS